MIMQQHCVISKAKTLWWRTVAQTLTVHLIQLKCDWHDVHKCRDGLDANTLLRTWQALLVLPGDSGRSASGYSVQL